MDMGHNADDDALQRQFEISCPTLISITSLGRVRSSGWGLSFRTGYVGFNVIVFRARALQRVGVGSIWLVMRRWGRPLGLRPVP